MATAHEVTAPATLSASASASRTASTVSKYAQFCLADQAFVFFLITAVDEKRSADDKYDGEQANGDSWAATTSAALSADWTEAEEAAVRWKLDLIVMPLLWLGFFVFQLERGNISNALTDGFLKAVGITQDQFNTGQGVLYLGIVLLEIPSNVLLNKFSAQKWLTIQVFAFGLVATFQAWQHNYASFLATRILLGVTECGYIPGALYTISTFYKRSELARRNAIFFTATATASACSGLLATGILPLAGTDGLAGWRWIFIVEGCMALFVALLFLAFMPASPARPTAILLANRVNYFTERERYILLARVVLDDARKTDQNRPLTWADIRSTLTNWRVYPHLLVTMAPIASVGAIGTYSPTIIKSLKFSTLKANALSSVGGSILVVMMVVGGILSDKTKARGLLVIAGLTFLWVWWIVLQQVSLGTDKWTKFAFLSLVNGFGTCWHPMNATWLSLNQATPQQRSVAMAMFVMAANTGAAVGSQIMRASDAPLYRKGFVANLCLVSAGLAFAIGQSVQYRWSNKRLRRGELSSEDRVDKYHP